MNFKQIFPHYKPVIGMVHLWGGNTRGRVNNALKEINIYEDMGFDGVIVENYNPLSNASEVDEVVGRALTKDRDMIIGINVLGGVYDSFSIAEKNGVKLIQVDSVQSEDLGEVKTYERFRKRNPNICVLGGVGFKYTAMSTRPLNELLREGMSRCEAIVTTGSGTGIETPLTKLIQYRDELQKLGGYHLISGAGVTAQNIAEQMRVADGVIVGSYVKKEGVAQNDLDSERGKTLMDAVRKAGL